MDCNEAKATCWFQTRHICDWCFRLAWNKRNKKRKFISDQIVPKRRGRKRKELLQTRKAIWGGGKR